MNFVRWAAGLCAPAMLVLFVLVPTTAVLAQPDPSEMPQIAELPPDAESPPPGFSLRLTRPAYERLRTSYPEIVAVVPTSSAQTGFCTEDEKSRFDALYIAPRVKEAMELRASFDGYLGTVDATMNELRSQEKTPLSDFIQERERPWAAQWAAFAEGVEEALGAAQKRIADTPVKDCEPCPPIEGTALAIGPDEARHLPGKFLEYSERSPGSRQHFALALKIRPALSCANQQVTLVFFAGKSQEQNFFSYELKAGTVPTDFFPDQKVTRVVFFFSNGSNRQAPGLPPGPVAIPLNAGIKKIEVTFKTGQVAGTEPITKVISWP